MESANGRLQRSKTGLGSAVGYGVNAIEENIATLNKSGQLQAPLGQWRTQQ